MKEIIMSGDDMGEEFENDTLSQIVDEMYDAANTSTLEHLDAAKIALRGFADRLCELESRRNVKTGV